MTITIINDGKVTKEFTGTDIIKYLMKQTALTILFSNIPRIVLAATPYNSPNYLKSQMVLFMLERLKCEELQGALRWWFDELPRDCYKIIKELL